MRKRKCREETFKHSIRELENGIIFKISHSSEYIDEYRLHNFFYEEKNLSNSE